MFVEGFDQPLYYAMQLPDPTEPRSNYDFMDFLDRMGRGDWWQTPPASDSNVLQVLFLMNNWMINDRTFGDRGILTHVTRVIQAGFSDRDAVDRLFLATLGRWSTDEEFSDRDAVDRLFLATLGRWSTDEEFGTLATAKGDNYAEWLADCQWALLNKLDFIFNY